MIRRIIPDSDKNKALMQSIHTLIQNDPDLFANLSIEGETGVRIQDELYMYQAATDSDDMQVSFDEHGSSLFAALRQGQHNETDEMRWEQQVNNVANIYRNKYSVVVYDLGVEISAEKRELYSMITGVLTDSLNAKLGYSGDDVLRYTKMGTAHTGASTYYAVKMRLNVKHSVRGGLSGKAIPIICRLFFRKDSDGLVLLNREEAGHIYDSMSSQTRSSSLPTDTAAGIKQDISYLLTNGISDAQFTDSALLSPESLQSLQEIANRTHVDTVVLRCDGMALLSYVYIKDMDFRAEIGDNRGHPELEVCFRMDSFSVYCRNCINQNGALAPLILNNRLLRSRSVTGTSDLPIPLDIDSLFNQYRLSREDAKKTVRRIFDAVLDEAKGCLDGGHKPVYELFYHLRSVRGYAACGLVCSARRHVCDCQLQDGVPACTDCPRPEIMYLDPVDGGKHKTKTRCYVFDGLCMQAKEGDTHTCRCCHRNYMHDSGAGLCPTCHTALMQADSDVRKKARKLYRQYRNVLPLTVRIAAGLAMRRKYAYEDNGIILFVLEAIRPAKNGQLSRRLYKFDKLAVTDEGYLQNAQLLHLS